MTTQTIEKLAARFKELYSSGEGVQWELAEISYQVVDVEGEKAGEFAALVGRRTEVINSYRNAWKHRLENQSLDFGFAETVLLANASPERSAAIQLVADDDGISVHTAKTRTEQVNYYKDIFKDADPEVLKAALKDKDARSRLRELSVETVMEDEPATKASKRVDPGPSAKPLSDSSKAERAVIQAAMAEIMHFSRATILRAEKSTEKFSTAMPNQWWERHVPGETVYRNHEEQVIGDIDRAIAALNTMRNTVQRVIDKAKVAS